MAPKMNFRESDAACDVAAATFNDDDADALVEMMQLMGPNYSAASARNDVPRRTNGVYSSPDAMFIK